MSITVDKSAKVFPNYRSRRKKEKKLQKTKKLVSDTQIQTEGDNQQKQMYDIGGEIFCMTQ